MRSWCFLSVSCRVPVSVPWATKPPATGSASIPGGRSAVDRRHVGVVVACACGGLQVVQPFELRVGELDAVGCGVLFDAGDAAGPGDGGDVVPAGEDPRERRLCGCRADLRADRADL